VSDPAVYPRGDGAYLGENGPRSVRWLDLLRLLRRDYRTGASIVWSWLTGKRLRARQRLAALAGVDHRLTLARSFDARPSDDPAGDDTFLLVGAERLLPGAARRLADAFAASPEIQAIYGDGLVQVGKARGFVPRLPPAFDPDFLLAVDYVGALAIRHGALSPPPADATDAALRIFDAHGPRAIGHLPGLLSIRTPDSGTEPRQAIVARLAAVRAHLDRSGSPETMAMPEGDGLIRITHPLPETPLVSVIVPTRDRLDLLRPCLDALRARTAWPSLEVIVCDNESREPETRAYLRALEREGRGVVVHCPGPFNFAAMNNEAARHARGRLLVFMNNDVEAFRADWLVAMARHALRPTVGAVGAKLLDAAGRIQHGGIILGTGGLVTHGHRHFPGDTPGYLSTLRAAHRVSAVTAACLMIEASKFASVGGFDAAEFAVDFNDVDLCLRLNAAGYRTILVPEAVLYHREAASRSWTPTARTRHEREIGALKRRWGSLLVQDPHYNPAFDSALSTHARLSPGFPKAGGIRRPQ
jgi:GT2 family glycosyltransferase